MSSAVTRMVSGDVIQVRTGVIQGIGPQGPTGPAGLTGPPGEQGAQGVPGPMGQIDDFLLYAHSVGNPLNVASNTQTTLNLNTVVRDDPKLVQSITNLTLGVGAWYVQASVTFTKPSAQAASGWRRIAAVFDGVEWDAVTQQSIPDTDTVFALRTLIPVTAARTLTFNVRHSDVVAISTVTRFFVTKLGPGAEGPAGPQGVPGPVGQTGPTGPQGPAGSLVNNTTTIAAIGG